MDEIVEIELSKIDGPMEPIRENIDPEGLRELAESIRENGLYEPILVNPKNGRYEVVFGHRRYLAHKIIGLKKIKAIIREMKEDEVVIARLIENIQRLDLDPIEEGRVYKKMMEEMKLSYNEIAKRTGKALNTIKNHVRLLELDENVQLAIKNKKLGVNAALELSKIGDDEIKKYYFESAINNGITIEVARRWVEDYEKTVAGKYTSEIEEGRGLNYDGEIKPIYRTCSICFTPVVLEKTKLIEVCQDCLKQIREVK